MTTDEQEGQNFNNAKEAKEPASVSEAIREIGEFLSLKRIDWFFEKFPRGAELSGLLDQVPNEFKIGDEVFNPYGPGGEEVETKVEKIMKAALAAGDQEIIDFCKKLTGKGIYGISSAYFSEAEESLAGLACLEKGKREAVLESLRYIGGNFDQPRRIGALFFLVRRGVGYEKESGDS